MTTQHHLAHLVPTPEQLAWQRLELGMFFHFGMNTFHGKEWSDGTLPASSFDPSELDADEWVRLAVEAGARYVVLTAKHHDGFCLWPTATTDYSVASSPWREGRGDVVAEMARACRAAGIGLGLYLSPWDRNHPAYADSDAYADVYAEQLTELCTRYGPLVELWFDGAGSEGYVYDWERTMAIVHEHQPQAMVFNMGAPTIRWAGNENGIASDPVEYTVSHTQMSNYTIVTTQFAEALYLPPECDVSVRRGWFWHPDDEPKTLEHLLAIYYRSVGMGANLLLNVPPDTRGRIDPADAEVIRALGEEIRRRFGAPIPAALERAGDARWRAVLGDEAVTFDHVLVREDLSRGQRVGAHRLRVDGDDVGSGLTIGANRLHVTGTRTARTIELEVDGDDPVIDEVLVYRTGVTAQPTAPEGYVAPTAYPED